MYWLTDLLWVRKLGVGEAATMPHVMARALWTAAVSACKELKPETHGSCTWWLLPTSSLDVIASYSCTTCVGSGWVDGASCYSGCGSGRDYHGSRKRPPGPGDLTIRSGNRDAYRRKVLRDFGNQILASRAGRGGDHEHGVEDRIDSFGIVP
jgi:hypothetical protein